MPHWCRSALMAASLGVRVEVVEGDEGVPSRLVGGSLKTLLYMTQLAAISQDPWFSRVQSPAIADHVAIVDALARRDRTTVRRRLADHLVRATNLQELADQLLDAPQLDVR